MTTLNLSLSLSLTLSLTLHFSSHSSSLNVCCIMWIMWFFWIFGRAIFGANAMKSTWKKHNFDLNWPLSGIPWHQMTSKNWTCIISRRRFTKSVSGCGKVILPGWIWKMLLFVLPSCIVCSIQWWTPKPGNYSKSLSIKRCNTLITLIFQCQNNLTACYHRLYSIIRSRNLILQLLTKSNLTHKFFHVVYYCILLYKISCNVRPSCVAYIVLALI